MRNYLSCIAIVVLAILISYISYSLATVSYGLATAYMSEMSEPTIAILVGTAIFTIVGTVVSLVWYYLLPYLLSIVGPRDIYEMVFSLWKKRSSLFNSLIRIVRHFCNLLSWKRGTVGIIAFGKNDENCNTLREVKNSLQKMNVEYTECKTYGDFEPLIGKTKKVGAIIICDEKPVNLERIKATLVQFESHGIPIRYLCLKCEITSSTGACRFKQGKTCENSSPEKELIKFIKNL